MYLWEVLEVPVIAKRNREDGVVLSVRQGIHSSPVLASAVRDCLLCIVCRIWGAQAKHCQSIVGVPWANSENKAEEKGKKSRQEILNT
jgi:hypothetical protein